MMLKKNNILFIIISLLSLQSKAQFHYSASIDSVKATGFYSIQVSPDLCSHLKNDLSDLRITDEKKQPVPYVIYKPYDNKTADNVLSDQKIIEKKTIGFITILIVENSSKTELTNFIVQLKSAAAERSGSLSGSDDKKNWFVILDSLLLNESDKYSDTTYQRRINFPASTYRYFRLIINNNKKAPVNITQVISSAMPDIVDTIPRFFPNPKPVFYQKDSENFSLVTITYPKPYQVSHIQIDIQRPRLYKRNAKILTAIKESLQQTWSDNHANVITISSDNFSGYDIPLIKSDTLYLLVENKDNPSLKVSSVSTAVINREIITQLEKNKTYTILMDNPKATAPVYDLQHFQDRIKDYKKLNVGQITVLPEPATIVRKQINKKWIWPVIILVLALLGFLTWKLTVDMKKKIEN